MKNIIGKAKYSVCPDDEIPRGGRRQRQPVAGALGAASAPVQTGIICDGDYDVEAYVKDIPPWEAVVLQEAVSRFRAEAKQQLGDDRADWFDFEVFKIVEVAAGILVAKFLKLQFEVYHQGGVLAFRPSLKRSDFRLTLAGKIMGTLLTTSETLRNAEDVFERIYYGRNFRSIGKMQRKLSPSRFRMFRRVWKILLQTIDQFPVVAENVLEYHVANIKIEEMRSKLGNF